MVGLSQAVNDSSRIVMGQQDLIISLISWLSVQVLSIFVRTKSMHGTLV